MRFADRLDVRRAAASASALLLVLELPGCRTPAPEPAAETAARFEGPAAEVALLHDADLDAEGGFTPAARRR